MLFNNLPRLLALGPVGICVALAIVAVATGLLDGAGLLTILSYNLILCGIGYAGRLPIHLRWGGYHSRTRRYPGEPEKRRAQRKLNRLVVWNGVSIVAWFALAALILTHPDAERWLLIALCVVFYGLVFWLGLETLRCTLILELPRGTEIVCRSDLGQAVVARDENTPRGNPFSLIFRWLKNVTPRHQMSAFLGLVLSAFLILPAAGYGGSEVGREIGSRLPVGGHEGGAPIIHDGAITYEDICAEHPDPGWPAPAPFGSQIHDLWLGGVGVKGFGGIQAGCAHAAEPVSGQTDVWVAPGYCGESLRSAAVAGPAGQPAMLFAPAAQFALQLASEGVLLGATPRHSIRGGDFYIIDTSRGSYLLLRSHVSTGTGAPEVGELACEQVPADNVPYTVVPPGLIGLLFEVSEDGWAWPRAMTPAETGASAFTFRPSIAGPPIAHATCESDTSCTAWLGGEARPSTAPTYISVAEVLALAR